MTLKRKIYGILFLCGFWIEVVQGQEAIPVTGGSAIGSGGSVSYTVGQNAFSAFSGNYGSIIQGIQQPYEISTVTRTENVSEMILNCIIYPNPTRSIISLSMESLECENIKFQLFDLNGILIREQKIESKEIDISMNNLSPSTYFLKVIKDKKAVKTFKIIKN